MGEIRFDGMLSHLTELTWGDGPYKGRRRPVADLDIQPYIDSAAHSKDHDDLELVARAIGLHPDPRVKFGLFLQLVRVPEFRDRAVELTNELISSAAAQYGTFPFFFDIILDPG